jgi:methylglutamate dehydrogenase subunit D
MAILALAPRSAFADVRLPTDSESVVATDRSGLELAAVLAHRRHLAELTRRIRARYALELPYRPRRVAAGTLALLGTGPGSWLAVREAGGEALLPALAEVVSGLAAVSDQSDAWGVLRLTGPRLREALVQLVPIDLDAHMFTCGCVASTVAAATIAVTLWRLEDAYGWPTFECAVPRSLAASFAHALLEATGA